MDSLKRVQGLLNKLKTDLSFDDPHNHYDRVCDVLAQLNRDLAKSSGQTTLDQNEVRNVIREALSWGIVHGSVLDVDRRKEMCEAQLNELTSRLL